jgi:hypothetical protein
MRNEGQGPRTGHGQSLSSILQKIFLSFWGMSLLKGNKIKKVKMKINVKIRSQGSRSI